MFKQISLVLILLVSLQECNATIKGHMDASLRELRKGDELRLKCYLDQGKPELLDAFNFQINGGKQIEDEFVKKNYTGKYIELNMDDVEEQSSMILCRHNGNNIAYTDLRVGSEPEEITDFSCVANNWKNITCEFHRPDNPVTVHYTVHYTAESNPGVMYSCADMKFENGLGTCQVKSESYRRTTEILLFTLFAKNTLGNKTQTFRINNFAIVKPNAVDDIDETGVTSNSAEVVFKTPVDIQTFPRKLDFEFFIFSKYGNLTRFFNKSAPSTKLFVIDLPYAHTWYEIKMRIKSAEATHEKYWSPWSELIHFKTLARRPDNPPKMAKGGFNYGPTGEFVYVYWQHLPEYEHNGDDFKYIVHSNDPITPNATKTTHLNAVFSNKFTTNPVEITVESKNEKGYSVEASSMMIPSEGSRVNLPEKLVKSLNNGTYKITWLPPVLKKNEIITDYTVFWCSVKSELPNNCDSSINFTTRQPNETFFVLKSNLTINFAIAANTKDSSSGMRWSSCTAANSHEIGKIKTIWIPRLTSTTIDIEWKLECTDSGTVVGYQIEYCSIKEPKTLECEETPKKVNTTLQKHTLENLKPYTTYRFNLRMFSTSTMGPASEPQANTTLEAAPSPVKDLMVREISNVSAELYWKPPEHANGVLLYYQIWVNTDLITDKVDAGNTDTRMNFTLKNLKAFTKYHVSVFACTKECSGKVSTNFTTTVGNPGVIEQPGIKTFNHDKLSNYSDARIEWNEPKFKGGLINYYEIRITKEVSGKIKESTYKMARKYCIYHELCSNNIKMYGFSIRAVNFLSLPNSKLHNETANITYSNKYEECDRNDEELMAVLTKIEEEDPHASFLKGNWSVPISHSCNSKDLNGAQIALLVGSLVVTLVMLVTFRYFYKIYRRMKDIFPQMPPGLEDLTGEKKKNKDKMEQEKIPDILRNVDNTSLNCEDESGKLLKTSRNNSINENDCSSSIRSESTQSEIEPNYHDDISYGAFENNDRDRADTFKQFIINPTTGEEITLSPTMKMSSTPHPPKPSLMINSKMPPPASLSGYQLHPPVKQSPSYVAYSIFNPLQSNTHSTLGGYEKPSILLQNNANHEKNNIKTPVVATTDQEGISGYVTHRQLSDFGHSRMQ